MIPTVAKGNQIGETLMRVAKRFQQLLKDGKSCQKLQQGCQKFPKLSKVAEKVAKRWQKLPNDDDMII